MTSLQLSVAEGIEYLVNGSPDKGDHLDAGGFQHTRHGPRQGTTDENLNAQFPDLGGFSDQGIFFPEGS